MKRVYLTAIVALLSIQSATACSLCVPVEKALKAALDWFEYSDCLRQRIRYSQITGRPLPPCDHNGKHDRPAK
jgi:hypothetical protein